MRLKGICERIEKLEADLRAKEKKKYTWFSSYPEPKTIQESAWLMSTGCSFPPKENERYIDVPDIEFRGEAREDLREIYTQLEKEYNSCKWIRFFRKLRLKWFLKRPSYDEVMPSLPVIERSKQDLEEMTGKPLNPDQKRDLSVLEFTNTGFVEEDFVDGLPIRWVDYTDSIRKLVGAGNLPEDFIWKSVYETLKELKLLHEELLRSNITWREYGERTRYDNIQDVYRTFEEEIDKYKEENKGSCLF